MDRKPRPKSKRHITGAFIVLCLFAFAVSSAWAKNLSEKEIRATVHDSIKAILTGKSYSPPLIKKQQTLRDMFEKGAVKKAGIEAMTKEVTLSIMDQCKTSRYILNKAPERTKALLSPHMSWKEVKKIFWEVGSGMVPDGEQVRLTIGTLAPAGTPWMSIPEEILLPKMARLSDNKFIVKVYGGGVMGEDTDILRKMDIGQLDGCGCTALGILAASPETSVYLLPGLFHNYKEVDYITEKFRKRIDKAFEKKGYILSSFIDTGFFYIFSKNRITGLDDLKKQKLSTWFGEVETTIYDELGIDATPVAVPETVSAFSTGMVDANLAPPAWMLGMQAYQYVDYYLKTPWLYSPAAVVISMRTKERLRKRFGVSETFAHNVQEMLIYEVSTLEKKWRKTSRNYEKKCLEAFEKKCGIKPVELPPQDRETLEQAFAEVHKKLAGRIFPKDLMRDIKKALKKYRSREM